MSNPVQFLFVCCQAGSESTCKHEILSRYAGLRFAFSRPGFLTFKILDTAICPGQFHLQSTFARVWGWSVGKSRHDTVEQLATDISQQAAELAKTVPFSMLHCWQRDTTMPGKGGFEPGISPVAQAASDVIREALKTQFPELQVNEICKPGQHTLCVVMVEPNEWWFGWHDASTMAQRWPGGAPPISLPTSAVNRAWLKIHEAVLWGQVPIQTGDTVAEIGSAPGGASQYLLELGAKVVAIDPAEMDPAVADHPSLAHVRSRARDVPKRALLDVLWLTIDVNMPPSYTIEVIRDYIQNRGLPVRGVIATLKLPDWKLAAEVDSYRSQFEQMGFRSVETRQLAFNRQELCLVALRKKPRRRNV